MAVFAHLAGTAWIVGQNIDGSGFYYKPYILSNTKNNAKLLLQFLWIKKKFQTILGYKNVFSMYKFKLHSLGMKSHPYFAFFWILMEKTASFYVVTMAVLIQNQQNTNLWAECLDIIPEWKEF